MESMQIQIGRLQSTAEAHEEHISNLTKSTNDIANNFIGTNLILEQTSRELKRLLDVYMKISEKMDTFPYVWKDDINSSIKEIREQIYEFQSKNQEAIIKKNILREFLAMISRNWYKIGILFAFIYLVSHGHNVKDLLMEVIKR